MTASWATTCRSLLGAAAAVLAAPHVARADATRLLRFIPQADLAVLDPIWTQGYVTRNHGLAVFDTLYGTDGHYQPQPQMAAGHVVGSDGLTWTITLCDGLRFHDGAPVLARDCVASIRRWGTRDSFGQTLMAATNELAAPDDRTIRFRLQQPFPLLTAALGKAGSNICAIMPQRLAEMDPVEQGGWSVFHTYWSGLDMLNPAVNSSLRGNGKNAGRGWPTAPRLETLRTEWLEAKTEAEQKTVAADAGAGAGGRALYPAGPGVGSGGAPCLDDGDAERLLDLLECSPGVKTMWRWCRNWPRPGTGWTTTRPWC